MVGIVALLMGVGWSGMSGYAEDVEPGGAHHAGGHDEAGEALKPETLQGIWHEVMEGREHLEETIATGKLDEVHKVAFHIRDLVKTLPKVSGELSTDTQQRLQESINRVADIAGLLDQYGDAGDAVNTKAQADRLAKLLQYIETLYPEGALHPTHSGTVSTYVCPMHPGVRQKQPGSCPKCGMTLQPIQPEAALSAGTEISHKSESKTGMEQDHH
jgi:hypothetical protein